MKPILKLLTVFLSFSLFISCSDDEDFSVPTKIKIVNLINGVDHVIVKIGDNPINYATTRAKVAFDNFRNFSILKNSNDQVDIVKEIDTINPIYSEALSLKGIHSLYLLGNQEEQQTFFIEDTPKAFTDSLVGIRFINLSKLSGPININIAGQTVTIVTGLAQESVTDYIEFPAKEADGAYQFEFRNASGALLSSIVVDPFQRRNISTKKSLTLAVYDKVFSAATILQRVTRVNNY